MSDQPETRARLIAAGNALCAIVHKLHGGEVGMNECKGDCQRAQAIKEWQGAAADLLGSVPSDRDPAIRARKALNDEKTDKERA